jgi:hypothetical protein
MGHCEMNLLHIRTTTEMNTANSDNIATWPKWVTVPSARLRDTENMATPELHSHQAAKSGTLGAGDSVPHESPSHTDEDSPHPSFPSTFLGQKCKRANNHDKLIDSDFSSDSSDEVTLLSERGKDTVTLILIKHDQCNMFQGNV